ncbi:MAG: tyrosine-type recombinase/integrase [Planctomycetes bacterium]|nr:tyrosine-type recombinase/integrase [Planctomycetota bacterium]
MSESTDSLGGDRILTLEAAARAYFEHLRLLGRSTGTIRSRTNAMRQFAKFWGGRDLRDVTPADLEAFALSVRGRLSRESAYNYLQALRSLFRYLAQEQRILVDPARRLPMPSMRNRPLGKVFTPEEMKRAIEAPDVGTSRGLRDRALLEFLYSTGLRSNEARPLAVEDVADETVTVRAGKGGKDRRVPLGAHAGAWVQRYLREARPRLAKPGETALWVMDRGRVFGEAWFRRHVRELGEAAGLTRMTCHAIRRSMATHLLSAGASPSEVAGILGHEDLGSLSRYAALAGVELKEAHARTHPREVGS